MYRKLIGRTLLVIFVLTLEVTKIEDEEYQTVTKQVAEEYEYEIIAKNFTEENVVLEYPQITNFKDRGK
ncbi:hypothetical protein [Lysinibacillus antri]|uniref:Uncharacterized protein n=1 Tax=Lysinibacillus antri TaxID=2498145 RepID=A0A432L966_9BACI|nr:hypothetical protein [Lysinibacillus antri]RUL49327.1 hypothetical protein EK386_15565 [Lysinibacillus antri]